MLDSPSGYPASTRVSLVFVGTDLAFVASASSDAGARLMLLDDGGIAELGL